MILLEIRLRRQDNMLLRLRVALSLDLGDIRSAIIIVDKILGREDQR